MQSNAALIGKVNVFLFNLFSHGATGKISQCSPWLREIYFNFMSKGIDNEAPRCTRPCRLAGTPDAPDRAIRLCQGNIQPLDQAGSWWRALFTAGECLTRTRSAQGAWPAIPQCAPSRPQHGVRDTELQVVGRTRAGWTQTKHWNAFQPSRQRA